MQIAIMKDGQITVGDYRDLFPNQTWPGGVPSAEWLADNNCMGVTVFKPHDSRTEKLVPAAPYIADGQVFTVSVAAKSQEEKDADTASQAAQVRAERNRRLAETDWRYRRDQTTTPEWDAYCAALRDLPQQPGFPWDVTWPEHPAA